MLHSIPIHGEVQHTSPPAMLLQSSSSPLNLSVKDGLFPHNKTINLSSKECEMSMKDRSYMLEHQTGPSVHPPVTSVHPPVTPAS